MTTEDNLVPSVSHLTAPWERGWTEECLDLLGTTTDKDLNFNKHIPQVCTKVNNELSVIIRFHKLIDNATKLKLYNALLYRISNTVPQRDTSVVQQMAIRSRH